MSRRKNNSVKWTLVLVLVVFSKYVYSRPQVESTILSINVETDKSTEIVPRYSYRHNNVSYKLPLQNITNVNNTDLNFINFLENVTGLRYNDSSPLNSSQFIPNIRRSREMQKIGKVKLNHNKQSNNLQSQNYNTGVRPTHLNKISSSKSSNKIKKVVTKWMDNTKYDDVNISHDTTISEEREGNLVSSQTSNLKLPYSSSTENFDESTESSKNVFHTQSDNKRYTVTYNKPMMQQYDDDLIYSDNVQITDFPYNVRPNYVFTTPKPTPIITNVGYPKPWPSYHTYQQTNRPTRKPIKSTTPKYPYNYNNVNHFSPFPSNNFDVTTFPPSSGYTDRIVIRPDQYNASPDDCPTIFVTLNNTFQGEGKEACPDLNIAVNTNVVNKNVVVESDEDTGMTLTDVFGLPLEESGSDENTNDYLESQENNDDQTEDTSNEDLEIANYNAANNIESESSEPANFASPSSALSTYTRPGRPDDDDDIFSSIMDFFKPNLKSFSWLAAINPLSFGALAFILTPLVILFAGVSGLVAFFGPWAFSGRELPEVHRYRPQWQLDDYYNGFHLNSMNDRTGLASVTSTLDRNRSFHYQLSWFSKAKEILKVIAKKLKLNEKIDATNRKSRRKKNTLT